jgi:hypothetical protein
MTKFQIWSEGYQASGDYSDANYFATVEAETFQEACDKYFVTEEHKKFYDPKTLTYWGCKLFDNETDARRSFG